MKTKIQGAIHKNTYLHYVVNNLHTEYDEGKEERKKKGEKKKKGKKILDC